MHLSRSLISTFFLVLLSWLSPLRSQDKPVPNFKSLDEVLKVLPKDVLKDLKQPSKIEAARRTANEVLQKEVVDKIVTFELELGEWTPWAGATDETDKIRVGVKDMPVDIVGLDFVVRLWVMLPRDQELILKKIRPGDEVEVTGKLTRFGFSAAGGKIFLDGDIRHSKIDP